MQASASYHDPSNKFLLWLNTYSLQIPLKITKATEVHSGFALSQRPNRVTNPLTLASERHPQASDCHEHSAKNAEKREKHTAHVQVAR